MRRNLINLVLVLVLVPATVAMVLALMLEAPSVVAFPEPTHRVAVAVDEAMRGELTSVSHGEGEFAEDEKFLKPDDHWPTMGKDLLPEDSSAFWLDTPNTFGGQRPRPAETITDVCKALALVAFNGIGSILIFGHKRFQPDLKLVILNEIEFVGKARDGRQVKVTVRIDTIGHGSVVDFHGDRRLARTLSDRIADRLAHPRYKHESPEDRQALMAFFAEMPSPLMPNGFRSFAGTRGQSAQQTAGPNGIDPSDEDH